MSVPLQETVPVVDPSTAGGVFSLLWVIVALPALGAAVILLLGNTRTSKWAHLLGCATVGGVVRDQPGRVRDPARPRRRRPTGGPDGLHVG